MTDRFDRFRHLERARPDREGEPADGEPAPTPGRFESVERPRPPSQAAPAAPGLELADASDRPAFRRCLRCGADSNGFATACGACGASLETDAQRLADARLSAALAAEREAEEARRRERQAAEQAAADEDARNRRAMAESLAREVGRVERQRLETQERIDRRDGWGGAFGDSWPDGGSGGWSGDRWGESGPGGSPGSGSGWTPLGFRLLRLLPPGPAQVGAAVAAVALVVGLVLGGLSGGLQGLRGPMFGLGVGLGVLLFTPPRTWFGRRRRWW